jgi:hypothetical protein
MKALEIRTIEIGTNIPTYKNNLSNVIVFLRHDEDKIIVKNNEQVEVEVYDNGNLIFIGTKEEFYHKLKS